MKLKYLLSTVLIITLTGRISAQLESSYPSSALVYKVLLDDPTQTNKLWVHLQPVTVDGMSMNAAVGSGLETQWISPFKGLELRASIRGNFLNAMDLQRRAASTSSVFLQTSKYDDLKNPISDNFKRFLNWEIGAFYPFLEYKKDGQADISFSNGANGQTETIEVNAKVIRSVGARLGFNSMSTTVSLNNAIEDQNIELTGSLGNRLTPKGATIGSAFTTEDGKNNLFTSFSSGGIYAGIGLQRKKNLSIKTENHGIVSSNSILTMYADLIVNPWTSLTPFSYTRSGTGVKEEFAVDKIKTSKLGFRTGFEIRFNEVAFISAGGEIGYRPSIQGQGFYAAIKIGIPVFSFGNQTDAKPSTNVGEGQSISK